MEYKIYVGTLMKISGGFMNASFRIMYSGMPNEDTFCMTPFSTSGYQGFSPTIFYSAEARVIQIFDKAFDVLEVNREYIIIAK